MVIHYLPVVDRNLRAVPGQDRLDNTCQEHRVPSLPVAGVAVLWAVPPEVGLPKAENITSTRNIMKTHH